MLNSRSSLILTDFADSVGDLVGFASLDTLDAGAGAGAGATGAGAAGAGAGAGATGAERELATEPRLSCGSGSGARTLSCWSGSGSRTRTLVAGTGAGGCGLELRALLVGFTLGWHGSRSWATAAMLEPWVGVGLREPERARLAGYGAWSRAAGLVLVLQVQVAHLD